MSNTDMKVYEIEIPEVRELTIASPYTYEQCRNMYFSCECDKVKTMQKIKERIKKEHPFGCK